MANSFSEWLYSLQIFSLFFLFQDLEREKKISFDEAFSCVDIYRYIYTVVSHDQSFQEIFTMISNYI